MKNKLLFSAAVLAVALGASSLSARSLDTFNDSDRKVIGACGDVVDVVVESFGLSSAATSKSTPLKAEATATTDTALIIKTLANPDVAKFAAKELGLEAGASVKELSSALTAKIAEKDASAFVRKFAAMVATTAMKSAELKSVLDVKVAELVAAQAKKADAPVVIAKPVVKGKELPASDAATTGTTDTSGTASDAATTGTTDAAAPVHKPLTADEIAAIPSASTLSSEEQAKVKERNLAKLKAEMEGDDEVAAEVTALVDPFTLSAEEQAKVKERNLAKLKALDDELSADDAK
jgi:hypothetical protein